MSEKLKIVRAICYKCAEFFDQPADGKVCGREKIR